MIRKQYIFNKPGEIDESLFEDGTGNPGGQQGGDEFKPDSRWDVVKSFLPEDQREAYALPEDLNKENEENLLREAFAGVFKGNSDDNKQQQLNGLHPLAASLQQSVSEKGEEFDPVVWFKDMQAVLDVEGLQSTSDADIVKAELIKQYGIKSEENPRGYTQEEFDIFIEKKDALSLRQEADKIREAKIAASENLMKFKSPEPPKIEDIKRGIDSDFEALTKSEQPLDVAGFDIRKAMDENTLNEVKGMFIPKEAGQLSAIQQKLSDPDWYSKAIVKLAFLESESGKQMITHMLSDKETRLKHLELIQKLNDDPDGSSSFRQTGNPNEIDLKLFEQ